MPAARNCPICGADNSHESPLRYSWRDWALKECRACRFVYLENPPPLEKLTAEHSWDVNHPERRERIRNNSPVYSSISTALRAVRRRVTNKKNKLNRYVARWIPPGKVADVGCGDGGNMARLPEQYEPVGVEISETLARRAEETVRHRKATILNMSAIDGMEHIAKGSLSGVIMRSFLEHETRPRELLVSAACVLKSDGAIIIKVPNYACINRRVIGSTWCGFHFPGHVNYFTPQSLRRIVESVGLQVARFNWASHFPLSDNMWLVARRPPSNT